MTHLTSVLIAGGGTAGNALAVLLSRAGIDVDLIEAKADWNAQGSGITLQGNALRVLRHLGVWDAVAGHGFGFDSFGITAPDGTVLHVQDDIRTGGPDLPATVGMQRSQLQHILIDAVRASATRVRCGTTISALDQDADSVSVAFSDGTRGSYDLVVAADGLNSATRAMIGITDRPEPTGMGIWRVAAHRPQTVERTDLTYGGPCYIAGYCPTGKDTLYAYLVEDSRDRAAIDPALKAEIMRDLAAGYGGAWQQIRASITDPAQVNYAWFDRLLVEGPWHRGRVVLMGDAAHACPPTLAQGAAMSLEDAAVLAEILTTGDTVDDALLTEYQQRRMPRVRTVVENSVKLGHWLQHPQESGDVAALIGGTMKILAEQP
jgi:2-polyprenyl-6-methoxyphenol hydroxylase-like FAD-dependent oxidoreductase